MVARECRALERNRDNYPKAVLSLDDASFGTRNGIGHVPVWQLLASEGDAGPTLPPAAKHL